MVLTIKNKKIYEFADMLGDAIRENSNTKYDLWDLFPDLDMASLVNEALHGNHVAFYLPYNQYFADAAGYIFKLANANLIELIEYKTLKLTEMPGSKYRLIDFARNENDVVGQLILKDNDKNCNHVVLVFGKGSYCDFHDTRK